MFERADQQYIAIHPGEPERLCWDCGESLFKVMSPLHGIVCLFLPETGSD